VSNGSVKPGKIRNLLVSGKVREFLEFELKRLVFLWKVLKGGQVKALK